MKPLPLLSALLLSASLAQLSPAQDRLPDTGMPDGSAAQPATEQPAERQEPTELDLPIDDTIKLKVDPVQVSNVVDKVNEPCTVSISSPGMSGAQLFLVPVDGPYGGRTLGKPRLIGADNRTGDKLAVRWTSKEASPYVKLFAVVRKKDTPGNPVRSRTIDIGIGGARLRPPAPQQ